MSLTDIETKARLEDAETQLEIERNLRDKAEQERDDAVALIAKMQSRGFDLATQHSEEIAQLKARIAELETALERSQNQASSEKAWNDAIVASARESMHDLHSARTAAELAQSRREELLKRYLELVEVGLELGNLDNEGITKWTVDIFDLQAEAKELLGEVKHA